MKFTAVAIVLLVAVVSINAIPLGDSNYNRNVNNNNNGNFKSSYSSLYNQLIAQQSGKTGLETEPVVAADDAAADEEGKSDSENADGSKSFNPHHPSSNYNYNSNTNNNANTDYSSLLSSLYSQLTSNQGTHPGHGIH